MSGRKLVLEIPHLPPRVLSPNARVHWGTRAEAHRLERDEVYLRAFSLWHHQEPMARARVSYEFHVKSGRIRDFDNLLAACKPIPDGLVEAGVLRDDSMYCLEIGSVRAIRSDAERTIVTVEEIQEGEETCMPS